MRSTIKTPKTMPAAGGVCRRPVFGGPYEQSLGPYDQCTGFRNFLHGSVVVAAAAAVVAAVAAVAAAVVVAAAAAVVGGGGCRNSFCDQQGCWAPADPSAWAWRVQFTPFGEGPGARPTAVFAPQCTPPGVNCGAALQHFPVQADGRCELGVTPMPRFACTVRTRRYLHAQSCLMFPAHVVSVALLELPDPFWIRYVRAGWQDRAATPGWGGCDMNRGET
eukprot:gene24458-biopygen10436